MKTSSGWSTILLEEFSLCLLVYSTIIISLSLAFANSSLYLFQILAS